MLRCPICQLMNMREDEVRGRCYGCGGTLKASASATVAGVGPLGGGGSGLSGPERLMCQVALVLGVVCFGVSAFATYKAATYTDGIHTAQAVAKRDFHASATVGGATGNFQLGHYNSYATFEFEGRTYKIGHEGHAAGERFTVHFRRENPTHLVNPTSPMGWWFAGGAAVVGLFLVAVGGGALYLMRPRPEPVQLVLTNADAAK